MPRWSALPMPARRSMPGCWPAWSSACPSTSTDRAMDLQPLVYVCVVSGFNLPELESCLARRPTHVLLIVSDSFQRQADRLRGVLERLLPEVQVHILSRDTTGEALQGDSVLENQRWVRHVLLPLLNRPPLNAMPQALNFTGGTKAMAAMLLPAHPWAF